MLKKGWRKNRAMAKGDGPIVVDPVYNLTFPSPEGGYYPIRQIRDDSSILPRRLDDLIISRGKIDKIAQYRTSDDGAHYGYPKTINLEKNIITRMAKIIIGLFVDEPELINRPRYLEDPKLFVTMATASFAGGFFALAGILTLV